MTISLKIHPGLFEHNHETVTINVSGKTVGECLDDAVRKLNDLSPELLYDGDKLTGHVLVYRNGEDTYPDELEKPVQDGDKLELLTIIGGG